MSNMRSNMQVVPNEQPAAKGSDASPEEVSSLMDGELTASDVEMACRALRDPEVAATWTCYHVIGDTLRGSFALSPGFSGRFGERLAVEATVLAPQRGRPRPLAIAWAAAATVAAVGVVGWVSLQTMPVAPTAVATARQATGLRASDARPAVVDNADLLVHQEYSPTTALQGVRPYLRAVTASEPLTAVDR